MGTVILNHKAHEHYQCLTWKTATQKNQHLIVHTLITDQTKPRQGIGSQMLDQIKQYGRQLNVVSIRLDTALTNLPARRLYEKSGFHYIGQTDLPKFDQTGSDECVFYEYLIR
ncbi:GNAT family N-acetyltransferase [Enterococcus bulliens]